MKEKSVTVKWKQSYPEWESKVKAQIEAKLRDGKFDEAQALINKIKAQLS